MKLIEIKIVWDDGEELYLCTAYNTRNKYALEYTEIFSDPKVQGYGEDRLKKIYINGKILYERPLEIDYGDTQ